MHRSKTCFKCNIEKPLSLFYKHSEMGDGHLNKCIECTKKDVQAHREKNIDRIRQYDRDRSKNKERMKKASEIAKKWRQSDSRILKAHNAVTRAIRSGKIGRKPCEVCGAEKSVAHHDSYNKPLEVKWYCQVHHKERHKWLSKNGIDPYEH